MGSIDLFAPFPISCRRNCNKTKKLKQNSRCSGNEPELLSGLAGSPVEDGTKRRKGVGDGENVERERGEKS